MFPLLDLCAWQISVLFDRRRAHSFAACAFCHDHWLCDLTSGGLIIENDINQSKFKRGAGHLTLAVFGPVWLPRGAESAIYHCERQSTKRPIQFEARYK